MACPGMTDCLSGRSKDFQQRARKSRGGVRAPVGDAQLVAELERDHELLEEGARGVLQQPLPVLRQLVLDHVLEHVAAGRELHHDRQVHRREEDLAELRAKLGENPEKHGPGLHAAAWQGQGLPL